MLFHSHPARSEFFAGKANPIRLKRSNTLMGSDSGKDAKQPGLREQRYTIRYPFAADAEMLELQSGTRLSGVTSDLSAGGCFVCVGHPLEVGARVRGTLTHSGSKVSATLKDGILNIQLPKGPRQGSSQRA